MSDGGHEYIMLVDISDQKGHRAMPDDNAMVPQATASFGGPDALSNIIIKVVASLAALRYSTPKKKDPFAYFDQTDS